jgi:hypothetical protein
VLRHPFKSRVAVLDRRRERVLRAQPILDRGDDRTDRVRDVHWGAHVAIYVAQHEAAAVDPVQGRSGSGELAGRDDAELDIRVARRPGDGAPGDDHGLGRDEGWPLLAHAEPGIARRLDV